MSYFVPNPAGIAAIRMMPGMEGVMCIVAGALAAEVVNQWNQYDHPYETGDFEGSIGADCGIEGATAVGVAYSTDDEAIYKEFGTEDTPAFQPFRLALDALAI